MTKFLEVWKTFLPAPVQVAPGGYEPWLKVCKDVPLEPVRVLQPADANAGALHLVATLALKPGSTRPNTVHLIGWTDQLLRDLGVIPRPAEFDEYAISTCWATRFFDAERPLEVTIYVELATTGAAVEKAA